MNIWSVQNKNCRQLRLWRIDEDSFRVTEQGEYSPLLYNATYTLINKKYALIFQDLIGQVNVRPVLIHDFVLKTANTSYVLLTINNSIDPETIKNAGSTGQRAWTYNGYLFVSNDLKKMLNDLGQDEFEFHPGFSMFA
jgi:hypothetical protein